MRSGKQLVTAILATLVLIPGSEVGSAQCFYEVEIVAGPSCGGDSTRIVEFEGIGGDLAVGVLEACPPTLRETAIAYSPRSGLLLLAVDPLATESRGTDANSDGAITGTVDLPGVGTQAFRVSEQGVYESFPTESRSIPRRLTEDGTVIGYVVADGGSRPFVWTKSGLEIFEPPFPANYLAFDANDARTMVGAIGISLSVDADAFVLEPGREPVIIEKLEGTTSLTGAAVNNSGQVAFISSMLDAIPDMPVRTSFVVDAREMTDFELWQDIGNFEGYDAISILSLNSCGVAVGRSQAIQSSDELDVGFIYAGDTLVRAIDHALEPHGLQRIIECTEVADDGAISALAVNLFGNSVGAILRPILKSASDVNQDCAVDELDLNQILRTWGQSEVPSDIDRDGEVGVLDLLLVLADWNP